VEFVRDKVTKEPFDPKHKITWKLHDLGQSAHNTPLYTFGSQAGLTKNHEIYTYLGTGADRGIAGDHMILAPAYNVTAEELEMIVDRVVKLITTSFEKEDYTIPFSTL
jgi:adenosylmethionine-8-amino-7-oxononanoate aminotransferase